VSATPDDRILDFTGQAVLITGAGRPGQVGEAVAQAFGQRGARVILIERDRQAGDELAVVLRTGGVDTHVHACDLTDVDAVSAVAADIGRHNPGGLHGMVHLAGGFGSSGPVTDSDPAMWHKQIAINLTTAYVATRAFLPLLRLATGSIVYFSSAAALPGGAVVGLAAYAAAKAGLLTLMRVVAAEEKSRGVRANALAPTAIRTRTNVAAMGEESKYVERETVAAWVLQLTHASSGPVTGQVIKLG